MPQKYNRKIFTLLLAILSFGLTLGMAACQTSSQQVKIQNKDAIKVTVSILPLAYFVERIGGENVSVNVMVGPGQEAHTYEPKPEQMKSLNDSMVFFSIGVEYEASWIPRFMDINPDLLVVNSAEGIQRIEGIENNTHEDEDEEHAEESGSEGLDPHVWLAPKNGKIIATNILKSLQELAPEQATDFQVNYDALVADIDAVDAQISDSLSGVEKRTFMVFHPAWGYFANQYNLEQIPVQVGGQDPSASELADLVNVAREEGIKVIFLQPTFNAANAQAIAEEIGAEVAVVDPLARDWLANLISVAEAFTAALMD